MARAALIVRLQACWEARVLSGALDSKSVYRCRNGWITWGMHTCLWRGISLGAGLGLIVGCTDAAPANDAETLSSSAGGTTAQGTATGFGGATGTSPASPTATLSSGSGGATGVTLGASSSVASGNGGSGAVGTAGGTASTGSAGLGGSASLGTLTLSDLKIEENPDISLACSVSWTTSEPASSEVQFGEGSYQFHIVHEEKVTEHRVLVIGMHAQTSYMIRAVSTNGANTQSAEGTFMTGALPSEVPEVELVANDPESSQSGWTLFNVMVGTGGGFGSSSPAILLMVDELGIPVWYYVNGTSADTRGDVSVDVLADGNVLIGPAPGQGPREIDLAGKVVWEGPANSGSGAAMTHHAGQISNGNFVVLRDTSSGGITGTQAEEYNMAGDLVWSWNLLDHITPPAGANTDWCHGNSVTMDLDEDVMYLNCRYLGLFKVQRSGNQDILWHMQGTQTPDVPGDFTFPESGSQFSDTHDPELHADGTILFYDNGGFAGLGGGNTSNFHSRVVEYAVDQDAKTAQLVWEFPGAFAVDPWFQNDWYAAYWGDADALENDNVLITIGLKAADQQSRILEVTRAGNIVWQIDLPPDQGIYRAQRLSPPPLVAPMP